MHESNACISDFCSILAACRSDYCCWQTIHFGEWLSRRQTIDKVGQLLGRGLLSKDNRTMKCTNSKLLTRWVTNGGPIWSGFMLFRSQKLKQRKSVGVLIVWHFCRHCRDVTSDTCHGSTISSADSLWKLNHARKVGQLYRSSDVGFSIMTTTVFARWAGTNNSQLCCSLARWNKAHVFCSSSSSLQRALQFAGRLGACD